MIQVITGNHTIPSLSLNNKLSHFITQYSVYHGLSNNVQVIKDYHTILRLSQAIYYTILRVSNLITQLSDFTGYHTIVSLHTILRLSNIITQFSGYNIISHNIYHLSTNYLKEIFYTIALSYILPFHNSSLTLTRSISNVCYQLKMLQSLFTIFDAPLYIYVLCSIRGFKSEYLETICWELCQHLCA